MAYSDISRAVAQTGTALVDPILQSMQDNAEDDIRAELEANGLAIDPTPVPLYLRQASFHWTCRNIYINHKHTGVNPSMKVVGSITVQVTIDQSITFHDLKGREALDRYIASQSASDEDSSDDDLLVMTTGED